MVRRIVVPRLDGAEVPAQVPRPPRRMIDPPEVTAIRMVYGVGAGEDVAPTEADFRPTYHVTFGASSPGGLDSDGVYEFDAARIFDMIRQRSLRRRWAMRLELELHQGADSDTIADLWVDTPFDEADASSPTMRVLGKTGRGLVLPGGGRAVVLATTLVHDAKRVHRLGGIYSIQLRDVDPRAEKRPSVASLSRGINIDPTRFEFE
jgi:hypothetical protein